MTWSPGAAGAVADNSSSGGAGTTTLGATGGGTVAVGDIVKISTTWDFSAGGTTLTVSDGLANTYTRIKKTDDTPNTQTLEVWESIIAHAGTPVYALGLSGQHAAFWSMIADHFTGSDASSVSDGNNGAANTAPGTGANAISSGNFTPATNGCLIHGAITSSNGGATASAGTGETIAQTSAGQVVRTFYKVQTTAASVALTGTTTTGSNSYIAVASATTPAATSGSPTVTPAGFGLTMSLGTPSLQNSSNPTITPTGFGLTMSLGTFTTQNDITLTGISGYALTMSLGTPTVNITAGSNVTITPSGLGLTMALGTPAVTESAKLMAPVGYGLTMALGTPVVTAATPGTGGRMRNGLGLGLGIR